jgi:hypothetical protein
MIFFFPHPHPEVFFTFFFGEEDVETITLGEPFPAGG